MVKKQNQNGKKKAEGEEKLVTTVGLYGVAVIRRFKAALKDARKPGLPEVDRSAYMSEATMEKVDRVPINIVFDGPPSHESGRFVEVETDFGRGLAVGEWIDRKDGMWALRISELPVKDYSDEPADQATKGEE